MTGMSAERTLSAIAPNGFTVTRRTQHDYKFVAVRRNGSEASWHTTRALAVRAAGSRRVVVPVSGIEKKIDTTKQGPSKWREKIYFGVQIEGIKVLGRTYFQATAGDRFWRRESLEEIENWIEETVTK